MTNLKQALIFLTEAQERIDAELLVEFPLFDVAVGEEMSQQLFDMVAYLTEEVNIPGPVDL